MKASVLLVRCLEQEGVEYVFGLPGEETMDINDALLDSTIRFIPARHEQGAAFMADLYGRLTRKAGVCLATLGPGATNLITGIADAHLDNAPLVAITGQAALDRIHKESHQYVDIVDLYRPITKWNARVQKGSVIPEVVRKAFKVAQEEKPGATHLEVPEDIAEEDVAGDLRPLQRPRGGAPASNEGAVREALRLIQEAEFPIILAGNGVLRGDASEALQAFADKTRIPVANTFMAKGAIPSSNPLSLMTIGLQAHDVVSCGFDRADLVICVGYDLVEYAPKSWNPERNKKVVHVHFTSAEVDENYPVVEEVMGDIRASLRLMTDLAGFTKDQRYAGSLRKLIFAELEEAADDMSFPVKPQRIMHVLRSLLAPDDILISDVGAHKLWVARMFLTDRPQTVFISNGFASMGIALPGAIAAKLVHPRRKVVAVCGDGGFLMNCQELETAARLGVNPVFLVLKDQRYGLIYWKQMTRFGRPAGVDFGDVDLVRTAQAFGIRGYAVASGSELVGALREALALDVPSIVSVPVDYNENIRLTEKLGSLSCPI